MSNSATGFGFINSSRKSSNVTSPGADVYSVHNHSGKPGLDHGWPANSSARYIEE